MLLQSFSQDPILNIIFILMIGLALIISLSFHEFSHALVADRLGDDTPRYQRRLTLNPLAHLDPMGTILLLMVGFGWGKPVMINAFNFKNPRRDQALVSLAGPLSNIILAVALSIVYHLFVNQVGLAAIFLITLIRINLGLAFFNLIPFDPLDGYKIVYGILPIDLARQWQQVQRFSTLILIIMLLTGTISKVIFPLLSFSLQLLGFRF